MQSERPASPSGEKVGPLVPDFELIHRIGQGGYGEVWLARGLTGVYRAIKVVWRDRFPDAGPYDREFSGLKKFTTMALLHVGQNEAAGYFYYVMELADDVVSGRVVDPVKYAPLTLKEVRMRRGRLPAAECVTFGVELARSLAGLHSRGLVHRDIKPSNVILIGGVPKLADIGLVAETSDALTYVGTQGFVPPEGPGKPAADVFALGKLLYELTTGLDRAEFPRLPPELNKLPDRKLLFELNEIILCSCEPESGRRYPDAAALLADLSVLNAGRSVRTWRPRIVLAGAGLALAVVAGASVYLAQRPRPAADALTRPELPAEAVAPATSLTEAQKLVAQARQLWAKGDELNRDNYVFPEELLKRAVALDPLDAEAWALNAQISGQMAWLNIDVSPARYEMLRNQTERARALAPQSLETQLAIAGLRLDLGQDFAMAASDLLKVAVQHPDDWRVQRILGYLYLYMHRHGDALRAFERSSELSGHDPRVGADLVLVRLELNHYAQAEKAATQGLARATGGRLLIHDIMLKARWRGDLQGALKEIATMPDWLQLEDRGTFVAWLVLLWYKQPDKALEVAQRPPREYLNDVFFSGPRAVLTARAHEQAGHAESARADWRTVVQVADRELATSPESASALHWKAWALARLGDQAQAQAVALQLRERGLLHSQTYDLLTAASLWATVGRADLAYDDILTRRAEGGQGYAIPRAELELDSAFDTLRTDPRFQELVKSAPAPDEPKLPVGAPVALLPPAYPAAAGNHRQP